MLRLLSRLRVFQEIVCALNKKGTKKKVQQKESILNCNGLTKLFIMMTKHCVLCNYEEKTHY